MEHFLQGYYGADVPEFDNGSEKANLQLIFYHNIDIFVNFFIFMTVCFSCYL